MDATSEAVAAGNDTRIDRTSERELVVTRVFDGPARIVFEAWTTPELLMRWWSPKSFGITFLSCEADVRPGGTYKFVFAHPQSEQPMAFVGRYIEVEPPSRLVWTNEESGDGFVTTLTFEERDGQTHLRLHDRLSVQGSAGRGGSLREHQRVSRTVRRAGGLAQEPRLGDERSPEPQDPPAAASGSSRRGSRRPVPCQLGRSRSGEPTYRTSGRIRRLSAACSRAWAVQPAWRASENVAGNRSGARPTPWSTAAA